MIPQTTSGGDVEIRGVERRVGPHNCLGPQVLPARHAPIGDGEKLGHSVFDVFITPDQSMVESEKK